MSDPRFPDGATARIGRRSLALLLFGFVYLVYGAALLAQPLHGFIAGDIPKGILTMLWCTAGAAAVVTALGNPMWEWLGFTSLYAVSGMWAAQYALSWLLPKYDAPRAWAGLIVWSLVTALVLLLAGWPEPPPRERIQRVLDEAAADEEQDRS